MYGILQKRKKKQKAVKKWAATADTCLDVKMKKYIQQIMNAHSGENAACQKKMRRKKKIKKLLICQTILTLS